MAENRLEKLTKDSEELTALLTQAKRQGVKDVLTVELRKINETIENVKREESTKSDAEKPVVVKNESAKRYEIKLNNYSWDQSDKSVKIYVSLKDATTAENVNCTFLERSFNLLVTNVANRDYTFTIKNLLEVIDTEKSYWKVKTDMVVIFLVKKKPTKWSHVTELEKKASEVKKLPDVSSDSDPTSGLMDVMRKMYETGDDEMKRMIAKAWTEGQEKKHAGAGF